MGDSTRSHPRQADPVSALALWDLEHATMTPAVEAAGAAFAELDKALARMAVAREPWDGRIEGVRTLDPPVLLR